MVNNNNNLITPIENKKPTELVQEIENYQIKKSPLSPAARTKVINKSGSNYVSNNKEGYGPMLQRQIKMQKQMSIQEKEAICNMFYASMERLEKYIEIVYKKELLDWENRKQIRDNRVKITNSHQYLEKFESGLSNQLYLIAEMLENHTTSEFRWELKQEFDRWISATRVNVDSSPERLKFLIFEINKVFGEISETLEKCGNENDYLEVKKSHELLFNKEQSQINRQITENFSDEYNYTKYQGGLTEKKARLVRINGRTVKVGNNNVKVRGFQHLIHTGNDWGDGSDDTRTARGEWWDGRLTTHDNGNGVQFCSVSSSAGANAGIGGAIASGGLDGSLVGIKLEGGGETRFLSGSVGGEIGIGPGGVVAGYSFGADAMSVQHKGLRLNVGYDGGSGVSFGPGGVEAKVGGVGFSFGKKMGISTPFGGVSVDLEEGCVVQ